MVVKTVCVGINRYLDPAMLELGGARRDAMALRALFIDTIERLAARRLVDEEATHGEVWDAILGTLDGGAFDEGVGAPNW